MSNKRCESRSYPVFHTFHEAQSECNKSSTCTSIDDPGCDGIYWYMCLGRLIPSGDGEDCGWVKGTVRNIFGLGKITIKTIT